MKLQQAAACIRTEPLHQPADRPVNCQVYDTPLLLSCRQLHLVAVWTPLTRLGSGLLLIRPRPAVSVSKLPSSYCCPSLLVRVQLSAKAGMQKIALPQSAPAAPGKQLGQCQPEFQYAGCVLPGRHRSNTQHAAKRVHGTVAVSAVQRAHSPSRRSTFERLTIPEAAPAVSSHPDAIRRRKEAEER